MNSRFIYILGIALTTSISAIAQNTQLNNDVEKVEKYTVQTNLFKDNWFVGANIGAQMYVGDHISEGKAGKLITPIFEVNAGKWFTPSIGLRLGFGGYQAKGYSFSDGGFSYERVDNNLYRTKWGILHLHGDVMLNFTNMFCGYREDRLYNAIPYVSIGYLRGMDNDENELSGGIGFINRFRLNKAWDLNLELRGTINNDVMDGIRGGKNVEGSGALMVGATYHSTVETGPKVREFQLLKCKLYKVSSEV